MKQCYIIVGFVIVLVLGFSAVTTAQYSPEIYEAQRALQKKGYSPGGVDGIWGNATQSAVKRFQRDVGLPINGQLDDQTKAKLGLDYAQRGMKPASQRLALVIGNGAYKSAPLKNPVNDAADMADALKKLGFSVTLKTNAIQRTIERAIRDFGKKLRDGGVGLFYYAGHGIQVKGSNYLIPLNAVIESEGDVKYEAVDAGLVLAKMEDAGNSLNIIILDACRDNPFARSFRSSSRGLAKMDAPTGSILAYATAPGSVASDGPGRNGLYTSALLKHMMTAGLTIEKMFKQVRIDVVGDSGKKQVPWESSSLTGDFYFNTDRGITVGKRPKPEVTKPLQGSIDKEMLFWQSVKDSNDPVLLGAYLEKFPNGTFAAIANVKINKLERKKLEEEEKKAVSRLKKQGIG